MPEEQIQEPQPLEQNANPPQTIDISLDKKQKKSKKWLWMLLAAILILILIGVGLWVWLAKPFSKESKNTTSKPSSTSSTKSETKKERTKYAYEYNNNIWVLDVVTKGKIQITTDGGGENYYTQPVFTEGDDFTYLKCLSSKCELWSTIITGNQFETKQIKKFNKPIVMYSIDQKLKEIVYFTEDSENGQLHLLNLNSNEDKVVYESKVYGRGGNSNDAFYVRFSPDASKFLFVDTIGIEGKVVRGNYDIQLASTVYEDSKKIVAWSANGDKLVDLTGNITDPVWKDAKTIIYKDVKDGIFSYALLGGSKTQLSSELDWSGIDISPSGKNLAYNKGFEAGEGGISHSSSSYVFNLATKTSNLLGENLVFYSWVNDNYLVAGKLKKCTTSDDCPLGEEGYTTENIWVVISVDTNKSYEIAK